jgi:small subunit ribosomal protein S21
MTAARAPAPAGVTSLLFLASYRRAATFGRDNLIMSEVKLKKGEPVERAIRRLKKKLDREQTLQQFRLRRRFEKPSARKRRKEKAARFSAMLKARYADD